MARSAFIANAPIRGSGAFFDARAVEYAAPRRGGLAPVAGAFGFIRNLGQGACAGLLTLLGAMHLTSALPEGQQSLGGLAALDVASLESAAQTILAGGAPGMIEIAGAVALFLNAGRGPARLLGLLSFVVIVIAHANGMDHADIIGKLGDLHAVAEDYLQKFQAARVS